MEGLRDVVPGLHLVRRVITRPAQAGGEDHDAVTPEDFQEMKENGAFVVAWTAHGLHYGIPISVRYHLNKGTDCLVNFSRKALLAGSEAFPDFLVLNISAQAEILAERLAARGRESEADIAKRLAEADKPLPEGLRVLHLSNDGPLAQTVARGAVLLQPETVAP